MIPRRIWINLFAFFSLFLLLANWAVRNVITLDQIDRPYRITADFESSPGLQANVAVTYLGVQVGTIDRVALEDGVVHIDLDIERGRLLPEGITANVRRKSAVGEPYVSLEMPPGYEGGPPYIEPNDEYHIPIESTSVPLSYAELFVSIDALLGGIPLPELQIVVEELARGLEGRAPQIREILQNTDNLVGTLAGSTELFDQLTGDLTQLTAAIASQRDALGTSFDNLALLTDTLAGSRADIEALLENAPDLGTEVVGLLEEIYPSLACSFAAAGGIFENAASGENIANLLDVLANAAGARDSFNSAIVLPGEDGADGYYLGGSFTPGSGAPPSYPTPATFPADPAIPVCDAAGAIRPGATADGSVSTNGDGIVVDGTETPPVLEPRPPATSVVPPPTTDVQGQSQEFPLAAVLLAFGAALALVLLGTLQPWRLLGIGTRDDDGDDHEDGDMPRPQVTESEIDELLDR